MLKRIGLQLGFRTDPNFPFRLVLKIIFDGCSLFKGADSAFFLEGRDGSCNGDVMHSRLKEKAEDAHKSEDTRS